MSGSKSGGLKKENWKAKNSPAIAPTAAPSVRACSLYEKTFFPSAAAASSFSRIDRRTRPHGEWTTNCSRTIRTSATSHTRISIVKLGSLVRCSPNTFDSQSLTVAWNDCHEEL